MLKRPLLTSAVLLLCASALAPLPLRGQDPPASDREAVAVFRISKKFLNDEADKVESFAEVPLSARILTFHSTAMIYGRGKSSIELLNQNDQAVFEAHSRGEGTLYVTG